MRSRRGCLSWSRVLWLFLLLVLSAGCSKKPFTVVLLPDTQNYSEKYPDTYMAQTSWIRSQAKEKNIRFVIHLGDIVQTASKRSEWMVADKAQRTLEGSVPYSLAVGNHDMEHQGDRLTRKTTLYDETFPPSRFEPYSWYGGHQGQNNANNYCFFCGGRQDFMVISLEFAPSDAAIAWAHDIVKEHGDCQVILATHYYMRPEGRVNEKKPYGLEGAGPQELWERFVTQHPNIFMVVSGHVLGVQHQTSLNDAGKPVHEILCDYQGEANGGDGWLQTLRFVPKEKKIYVEAYSPTLNRTNSPPPHTYALPWER